ncbi:MAG: thiamine phosphate synthase [Candidatus Omnitrophota bacterium]|nr:thiamine phosphate synthase [Candidatus Omnitrophota bacterium]
MNRLEVFKSFRVYAVTSLRCEDDWQLRDIESAYRGGADIVQLRSKTLSDAVLFRLGLQVRKIADRFGKLYFVNDRLDLALGTGADGLHVGQDDLPVSVIRNLFARAGRELLIGKSTHSYEQAVATAEENVDYIGVGPIFETPTKPDYKAVGLSVIQRVTLDVDIPIVAIGGIDETNLKQVLDAGARRVAVVRGIFGQKDVENAVRKIRECVTSYEMACV